MTDAILLSFLVFCLLAVSGLLFIVLVAVMATQRFGDGKAIKRRPF
jgi:hypothetical protein